MKYKAIIFDLDGTAIPSIPSGMPSSRLINTIKLLSEKICFSCATGRNWPLAKRAIRSLHLTSPCIISAGTQIINPVTEEILWQKEIEKNDVREIATIVQHYPYLIDLNDEIPDPVRVQRDDAFDKPLYLVNVKTVGDDMAGIICRKFNEISSLICIKAISQTKGFFDLHITNKEATKENAIKQLYKLLNLDKKDVVGIGDGHNDTHLFNAVGYKVAMGNAVNELKSKADLVIGSIENDGLALFIEGLYK
jgi:HAD superfamily hydrolase (TIGR01484 family)